MLLLFHTKDLVPCRGGRVLRVYVIMHTIDQAVGAVEPVGVAYRVCMYVCIVRSGSSAPCKLDVSLLMFRDHRNWFYKRLF
jgi:hypothetical protein